MQYAVCTIRIRVNRDCRFFFKKSKVITCNPASVFWRKKSFKSQTTTGIASLVEERSFLFCCRKGIKSHLQFGEILSEVATDFAAKRIWILFPLFLHPRSADLLILINPASTTKSGPNFHITKPDKLHSLKLGEFLKRRRKLDSTKIHIKITLSYD